MKIFLVGINGKMGKAIVALAEKQGITVVGGIDVCKDGAYPVFEKASEVNVAFDVIIDFSRPSTLNEVIELARASHKPAVIATTGYLLDEQAKIDKLAEDVPVFQTANMSLGINVVESLLPKLASALSGYDVEIVEAHHNQKVDAPSGTALLLEKAVERGLDYKPEIICGREGQSKRKTGEIGMHSIRGGSIVGEHTIIFAGDDEIIEVKHTALSRKILGEGALKAAEFLLTKKNGKYSMRDYVDTL